MTLRTYYPEIEPYASGHLDVGNGHGNVLDPRELDPLDVADDGDLHGAKSHIWARSAVQDNDGGRGRPARSRPLFRLRHAGRGGHRHVTDARRRGQGEKTGDGVDRRILIGEHIFVPEPH